MAPAPYARRSATPAATAIPRAATAPRAKRAAITLASIINVSLSPMTIAGNGVTIDGTSLTGSSGLFVVHSNASFSMSQATLEGGGNSGQGPIHAAGNISLSNVTIRDFTRTAITTTPSGSVTLSLGNVLIEDAVGSYNSHLQSGTVFDISNTATVTVENVVLRRLFGAMPPSTSGPMPTR